MRERRDWKRRAAKLELEPPPTSSTSTIASPQIAIFCDLCFARSARVSPFGKSFGDNSTKERRTTDDVDGGGVGGGEGSCLLFFFFFRPARSSDRAPCSSARGGRGGVARKRRGLPPASDRTPRRRRRRSSREARRERTFFGFSSKRFSFFIASFVRRKKGQVRKDKCERTSA